jgi:2-oxoglutarate ferredoxin oxidoreductase subunit beta
VRFGPLDAAGVPQLGLFLSRSGAVEVRAVTAENETDVIVHDAHAQDPTLAFGISRLTSFGDVTRAPIGIFRQVARPVYDDQSRGQVAGEIDAHGAGDFQALIDGKDHWHVH